MRSVDRSANPKTRNRQPSGPNRNSRSPTSRTLPIIPRIKCKIQRDANPEPSLIPASCTEKGRLLKEWSRTAAEVAELTQEPSRNRGVQPRDEYAPIRDRLENTWRACENARNAFQWHQSEHGC